MLKLTEALDLLDEAIKGVEEAIEFQAKAKDPIIQEIARRSFIREFARLGERLVYFRGPNPERMSQSEIEGLIPQFIATQAINGSKDNVGQNLVQGFTSRRNRLLHQYLADFYRGDNSTYEGAINYFKNNIETLKQGIQKARAQNVEIEISKISYDPPEPKQDIDFTEEYQLPIEVASREISWLKQILAYYKIDIGVLVENQNRKADEPIGIEFYNESLKRPALVLRNIMTEEVHLFNAISNIIENTCSCLKMINNGYELLRQKEGKEIHIILDEMDEIYNNLESEEYNAFDFLRKVARYRLTTAHDFEPDPEQETQFISDIISLCIIDNNYLLQFLKILSDNNYEKILKQTLPIIPHLSLQQQGGVIEVNGLHINTAYEYEDVDINTILDAYVRRNSANLPNVEVLGAVDNIFPEQLEARLRHAQENYRGRTLLIPYNLGNYHWVGLLVELDETGQPRRAICCDPLGTNRESLKCIEKYFKNVFPISNINYVNYLRQTDGTSCGAVTIDNLLMLAGGGNPTEFRLTRENTAIIRAGHIEMLRLYRPDFAEQFNRRQRENRPTVSSFATQMSYHRALKDVKFSAKEADVIIQLAGFIENLEDQKIKELLKQAFLYNDSYKENVKAHLNHIRAAVQQALFSRKSNKDAEMLVELADRLFGVGEMILTRNEEWEFRLQYQMLVAIGNLINQKDIELSSLKSDVEQQIAEDELLARRLQEQEWRGSEKREAAKSSETDTAEPKNRKGLIINFALINQTIQLPEGYMWGTAVDDGGCFFDALAQRGNSIEGFGKHNEKSLRMMCHAYYLKNKAKVDEWNRKEYGGIDSGAEDYYFVQYTAKELREFGSRSPIWGRSEIEGRILCEILNIPAIYVIELRPNPENKDEMIPTYLRVTKEGAKQVDEILYKEDVPILVVGENGKHFVPLLPKPALKKDKTLPNDPCNDDKLKKKDEHDKDDDAEHGKKHTATETTLPFDRGGSMQQSHDVGIGTGGKDSSNSKKEQSKSASINDEAPKEQDADNSLVEVWNKSSAKAKSWRKERVITETTPHTKPVISTTSRPDTNPVSKPLADKSSRTNESHADSRIGRKF